MLPKRRMYQIEALLTPIVETYTVIISLLFAILLLFLPGIVLMTPDVAYGASLLLVALAAFRYAQGYQIKKYQKGLKKLPRYSIKSDDIPVSNKQLFLGKGFMWRSKHISRLRELDSSDPDKWLSQGFIYNFARWAELKFEHTPLLKNVVNTFSSNSILNPARPLPDIGGTPEIHAVGLYESEKVIGMPLSERNGHTLVLGTTRVGKTRLAEILITQDIRRGDRVIVFDPKGDADLFKRVWHEAKKAGRPFYGFHLGYPDISARYNPIGQFSRITEVAGRVTDQVPGEGSSAVFKMFGWRFVNIISQTMVNLGIKPTYPKLSKHLLDIEPLFIDYCIHDLKKAGINVENEINEQLDTIDFDDINPGLRGRSKESIALLYAVRKHNIEDPVLDGVIALYEYPKNYSQKLISSLTPLIEKLTTGRLAEILSPDYEDVDDPRPIFDWATAIQQNAVVYCGFDCLADAVVGGAVASSMLSDLTSVSSEIYKFGLDYGLDDVVKNKKKKSTVINLHVDELEAVLGPQFIPLVNRSGGAGFQITSYTQTSSDIEVGIGSKAEAEQIAGNFNNIIMMRVKTTESAKYLTELLKEIQVSTVTAVSRATDSSDVTNSVMYTSTNEDRETKETVALLSPYHLTSLPKGQAFMYSSSQLSKVRLPFAIPEQDLPDGLNELTKHMAKNYLPETPTTWYSENDFGWFREPEEDLPFQPAHQENVVSLRSDSNG